MNAVPVAGALTRETKKRESTVLSYFENGSRDPLR
jgi:hypothetical protein